MKLSVILPVYNKERYIKNILWDLSNQIFKDYECIVIDDGSTDLSGHICDSMTCKDNRFKVIHIKNGGVSNARNIGLDRAKGNYITFLDADDRISPEYLKNLVECMENHNVDMVISGHQKVWEDCEKVVCVTPPWQGCMELKSILPEFCHVQRKTGLFGCCVAKIFRNSDSRNIRFDTQISLAEDFDFYLRLYLQINTIYFDDKTYYYYLQAAENSSVRDDSKIDYKSQLKINIRYQCFMKQLGFYQGDNQKIIESNLSNYIYFVFFYSRKYEMQSNFRELYQMYRENDFQLHGDTFTKKLIFTALKINFYPMAAITLRIYRMLWAAKRFIARGV